MLAFKKSFSVLLRHRADFSHVVIGGGVVGVAVGSELQLIPSNNVAVLEKHSMLGMETTSRNSEVIHAGIYYPPTSLKARLCVRGKELIYRKLDPKIVPYRQCGKWVVAQSENEGKYLEKLHQNASDMSVSTKFVTADKVKKQHPLIRAEYGALDSPTTGIISSHDLTQYFQAQFENAEGTLAINTRVCGLEYRSQVLDYLVHCVEMGSGEKFTVSTDNIINCAGLHAPKIANMLLPSSRHFRSLFAKGSYFSYVPETPVSTSLITTRLIYPCPHPNASGLGTHMTFDMGGQIRFGPDLEWIKESIEDASTLDYSVSLINIEAAQKAIASYYPSIKISEIQPSYSGFRPKLYSQSESVEKFSDFYIKEEKGFPGFVNMIGIESPGLTSAFAIAEYVREIYH
ncbi:glycerol-3-phospate dehydrogenase [Metschnikowia bicuspidata var. bicuspidata NRRL YB-4993]|uniref:L-2-hydroxyglutarate dehydrogenase, mitochondrial n=1 Tax=Metschnikowia bicuspidata var. bicuspidata NRRL YB-4993 TaxID=869754 RepID=A0A1A0H5Y4_9ASCO|nr:glycerol-3-phospate dehydrogenase [Metschnikowia bicuspidata var. bicuspidata NRRL YB-4993]OBA19317.1 glycerol-3-phospate dehydrogenase [Metschnikowia bicuspidata var. bicuspidata NRRL YB-4993]